MIHAKYVIHYVLYLRQFHQKNSNTADLDEGTSVDRPLEGATASSVTSSRPSVTSKSEEGQGEGAAARRQQLLEAVERRMQAPPVD